MNWNSITLFKYQQAESIMQEPLMSEEDKKLNITCIAFDVTEFQLTAIFEKHGIKKIDRMVREAVKVFQSPFKVAARKRVGRYSLKYDISKMTMGQFVELSFFLSLDPTQNAHYVLASISNLLFRKYDSKEHRKRSEYFLKQPIIKIIGCLKMVQDQYMKLITEYKTLFGLDEETNGAAELDLFQKRYGWIYATSQIAEYERVAMDEAFRIPVRQALNDLGYLKAKAKYEAEQLRKMNKS